MSLAAAIGQIDSILQLQQQILDPSATSSGASPTTTSSPGGGSASTSFADMLAGAQTGAAATGDSAGAAALSDPISAGVSDPLTATSGLSGMEGLSSLTGLTGAAGTSAPTATSAAGAPAQVQAMAAHADSLLGKPYVWGGGHSGWGEQPGYDCSGFVSSVLHAGGYLSAPQDTQTLPSQPGIAQGPGRYVTIYDRTDAGSQDHVIIDVAGQFYESGGGHGAWGGGGGVEKIDPPSAAYLSSFNLQLHPQGL